MMRLQQSSDAARGTRAIVLAAGLACGSAGLVSTASGQTLNWAAAASGNWSDSTKWNPNGVPNGATFNAVVTATGPAYVITVDGNFNLNKITLNSANATINLGSNNITVNDYDAGVGMFRSAARATSGTLTVNGQLRFSNTVSSLSINKTKIKTFGTIVFDQSSDVDICDTDVDHGGNAVTWNGSGDILLRTGAVFKNGASSTFSISSNATFGYANVGSQGTVINDGIIDKSAGGGTTFFDKLTFNNTGTVKVSSGTFKTSGVVLAGGTTLNGGRWEANAGGNLSLVDTGGVNDLVIATNAADVVVNGAASTFNAIRGITSNAAAGKLTVTGGQQMTSIAASFTNSGTLTVGASSKYQLATGATLGNMSGTTLNGGTFNLSGLLQVDNLVVSTLAGNVTLDGAASKLQNQSGVDVLQANLGTIASGGKLAVLSGRNFTTNGNFNVAGTGVLRVDANTTFTVASGSTLTNLLVNDITDGNFEFVGTNAKVKVDNASIDTISSKLTYSGVGSGFFDQFGNDATTNVKTINTTGKFTIAAGRDVTTSNILTLAGELVVDGAGARSGGFGGRATTTFTVNNDVDQLGTLTLANGGVFKVTGNYFIGSGGSTSGSGIIDGNVNLSGGTLGNGITVTGTVNNGGTIGSGGTNPNPPMSLGGLTMANAGTCVFTLGAGGVSDVLNITGTLQFTGGNAGTLQLLLASGYDVSWNDSFTIVNAGLIVGQFGALNAANPGHGLSWQVDYSPNSITVTAVPAPGGVGLALAGLSMLGRRRR
ncbi:MAG: hypothetical protein SFY96_03330 [Planctomycetota bacterium]|nr:hypothetical protein [Planctomycetota bacterium]